MKGDVMLMADGNQIVGLIILSSLEVPPSDQMVAL